MTRLPDIQQVPRHNTVPKDTQSTQGIFKQGTQVCIRHKAPLQNIDNTRDRGTRHHSKKYNAEGQNDLSGSEGPF